MKLNTPITTIVTLAIALTLSLYLPLAKYTPGSAVPAIRASSA